MVGSLTLWLIFKRSELSHHQLNEFYNYKQSSDALSYLSKAMKLDPSKELDQILLDFYFHNLRFCMENNFTPYQTSTFFSIAKKVHEHCTESQYITFDQDYDYFKKLLLDHSIHRPPFSIRVFTYDQISKISEYMMNTYFRHYLMYKFCYTKKEIMDLSIQPFVNLIDLAAESTEPSEPVESEQTTEISQLPNGPEPVQKVTDVEEEPKIDLSLVAESAKDSKPVTPETIAEHAKPSTASGKYRERIINYFTDEKTVDAEVPIPPATPSVPPATLSPQAQAAVDLKTFILTTLQFKMEELKMQMRNKLEAHEETLHTKIKRLEDGLSIATEDDKSAEKAAAAKKKEAVKKAK